jgi:two-component system, cell cycle response regulator DivK
MTTAAPDADAAGLRGKVLYIEDAPVNLELMRGMLGVFPGVQMIAAATGRDGVRLVREEKPDFVILDMNLPDIGGLEVVRQLSEDIAARGLRVTILTGDTLSMDIIKAMSLGAFEYWTKPVEASVLESGLRRALTGRRPHPDRQLPRR